MSLTTVNYHTAEKLIIKAFKHRNVPYLKGSPGTGKSEVYAAIAKEV